MTPARRLAMARELIELHSVLARLRRYVQETGDAEAMQLWEKIAQGAMAPIRPLRLRLNIPDNTREMPAE